ncbi:MAG: hypothetical protein JWP03_4103 [Phycisphaerales bacterium]|jgi:hypothetical protein|nr:hypothetical protein [Phycisphaerales bacterium]
MLPAPICILQFALCNLQSLTRANRRAPISLAFTFCLLLSSHLVGAADAAFSLPLQGNYRAGKYMPVHVAADTDGADDVLILHGQNAVPTEISAANKRIDAIVPWLAVRTVHDVQWSAPGTGERPVEWPLHALGEDERLIGFAGADPDALAPLFPGRTLLRVPLDLARPLAGPAQAWEALDGIVLDAAAASRMDESQLRGLVEAGTAVAIRSERRPGGPWPWRKQSAYWVLHVPLSGPQTAFVPEGAYDPTQAWLRGWPGDFRRHVILAAVLFAILATGVTLWRSRWSVLVSLALCATSAGFIMLWRARQPVTLQGGGSVLVLGESTTQRDDWTYRAVLRPADGSFARQPAAHPVFAYPRQIDDSQVRLTCAADGRPLEFRYSQKPRQSLAFLTRSLLPVRLPVTPSMPISSPLRTLADSLYAGPGDRLLGQVMQEGDEGRWPDVVVEASGSPAP